MFKFYIENGVHIFAVDTQIELAKLEEPGALGVALMAKNVYSGNYNYI